MISHMPSIVPIVEFSSRLNQLVVESLQIRYPFLEAGSIGSSVMGKDIPYIRIGTGNREVFYNASFHANEWITTPIVLKFVEDYAKAYATRGNLFGVRTQQLFEEFSLYIVPMVNPDGVDLVNGFLTDSVYLEQTKVIAENYPGIRYPSGWKANIEGIDLNLQFPAGWERARETKFAQGYTMPAPRDYVGEGPLTAPESLAVYDFTQNHNFELILAYHTQGEVIYWKYADYDPPQSYEIATYFGQMSGYAVETTPESSGYAGYKDWFIQEYNRPGYTIEVGKGTNPLPLSEFYRVYYDNRFILLGGMTQLL